VAGRAGAHGPAPSSRARLTRPGGHPQGQRHVRPHTARRGLPQGAAPARWWPPSRSCRLRTCVHRHQSGRAHSHGDSLSASLHVAPGSWTGAIPSSPYGPTTCTWETRDPWRWCRISITSSPPKRVHPTSIRCAGKIGPANGLEVRVTRSSPGAPITPSGACNATAAKSRVASAPSMTSRTCCWTAAGARSCTGFWPFCCAVSPARRGPWRERWACRAGPTLGGAGGAALRRCPRRCLANSKVWGKQRTSTTPPAPRGKRTAVAQSRWGVERAGAVSNTSLVVAPMTKTSRRSLPGSQGTVVIQATRDCPVKTVRKVADVAVHAGSRLSTDSASSYRALKGSVPEFVNHPQKEDARGDGHENRAECLFSLLKPYLRVFRGRSRCNLPGSVGFLQFLRNVRQHHAFEQAKLILQAALDPTSARRAKKGQCVPCFDHFDLLQTAIN
jgi:hypothetical protein